MIDVDSYNSEKIDNNNDNDAVDNDIYVINANNINDNTHNEDDNKSNIWIGKIVIVLLCIISFSRSSSVLSSPSSSFSHSTLFLSNILLLAGLLLTSSASLI